MDFECREEFRTSQELSIQLASVIAYNCIDIKLSFPNEPDFILNCEAVQ